MSVSPRAFEFAILIGAAVLALWLVGRFPTFGPSSFRTAFLNVSFAYVVALFAIRYAPGPVCRAVPKAAVGAAFTSATLPPLTYVFTTVLWFIRNVQRLPGVTR